MTTKSKVGIPSLSSSIAHFLFGLDLGCLLFGVYLLLPASLPGLPLKIEWPGAFILVWAFPICLSAATLSLAWWRPLPFLRSRGVAVALLALNAILTLLVLAAGIFLFLLLSRVLSGC